MKVAVAVAVINGIRCTSPVWSVDRRECIVGA
jgi:hypothetical protein